MATVRWYLLIKDEMNACNGPDDYVLRGRENQVSMEAAKSFNIFNMLTVEIQAKGMDLLYVRQQFDSLLSYEKVLHDGLLPLPESENRCNSSAGRNLEPE